MPGIPPIPPIPPMPPSAPGGGAGVLDEATTSSIRNNIPAVSVAALIICSLTIVGSYIPNLSQSST